MSSGVVVQFEIEIRIAACPCHRVPPAQHVPPVLHSFDHRCRQPRGARTRRRLGAPNCTRT